MCHNGGRTFRVTLVSGQSVTVSKYPDAVVTQFFHTPKCFIQYFMGSCFFITILLCYVILLGIFIKAVNHI